MRRADRLFRLVQLLRGGRLLTVAGDGENANAKHIKELGEALSTAE